MNRSDSKSPPGLWTREALVRAMMELVEIKPLSAISITELTSRAGVCRMTYYRNYHSKDEIFISYLNGLLDSYRRDVQSWTDKGNYCDYKNMLHCYSYFYTHKDFIRCLLKCGMGDLLLKAVTDYIIDTYYKPDQTAACYYTLQAFAGSLYNIYIAWIQRDARESAEEMASLICSIYAASAASDKQS